MSLKINIGVYQLKTKSFLFPAGEVGFQIEEKGLRYYEDQPEIYITARVQTSNDLFEIALAKDALSRIIPENDEIHLILPYIPYGRQDKTHNPGEPLSLKVVANFINSLNFKTVTTYDCHSEVTNAVFNNLIEIDRLEILKANANPSVCKLNDLLKSKEAVLVSPDVGANKKIAKIAGYFGHSHFIRADKLRELSTGKITETIIYADDLNFQTVVILDDLCDGGATFIELAKVLKKKNAGRIILYVTHGIFSKGYDPLLKEIDEIYTTNSYQENIYPYPKDKIHIIRLTS